MDHEAALQQTLPKLRPRLRAAFAENDPAAYSQHQRRAGRRGFKAAGQKHDWAFVNERSRLWRLEHPSGTYIN